MSALEPSRRFDAPWCLRLRLTTAISLLVFFGLPVILAIAALREDSLPLVLSALASFLFFGLVVWLAARTYLLRGYSISRDRLVVHRLGRDHSVDLTELLGAEADPDAMAWTLSMTNGGLFSFGGTCWNRRLGTYKAFATDPSRSVVLRFPDRRMVVTPNRPRELADLLARGGGDS